MNRGLIARLGIVMASLHGCALSHEAASLASSMPDAAAPDSPLGDGAIDVEAGSTAAGDGAVNDGGRMGDAGTSDAAVMPPVPPRPWGSALCDASLSDLTKVSVYGTAEQLWMLGARSDGRRVLRTNLGQGWVEQQAKPDDLGTNGIVGNLAGELFEYGGSSACSVRKLDADSSHCSAAISGAQSVFPWGEGRGLAVYKDVVLSFDGSDWTQWGAALDSLGAGLLWDVWGDESRVIVASARGAFVSAVASRSFSALPGAPNEWIMSAFAAKQVAWLGTRRGALHRVEGGQGANVWQSKSACTRGVIDVWAEEGRAVFITAKELGVVDAGGPRLIQTLPCNVPDAFTSLWGDLDGTVLVGRTTTGACGEASVSLLEQGSLTSL